MGRVAWLDSARVELDDHLDVADHGDFGTLGAADQCEAQLLQVHVEVIGDLREDVAVRA